MLSTIVNNNPNHVDEKFEIFLVEIEQLQTQWSRRALGGEVNFSSIPSILDEVMVLSEMSGIDLTTGYRRNLMISNCLAWANDQMEALSPVGDDRPEPVDGYGECLKDRPTPYEVRESIRGCFQGLMDQHGFTVDDLVEMMSRSLHFDLANPQRDLSAIREKLLEVQDGFRLAIVPNREVDKVEV